MRLFSFACATFCIIVSQQLFGAVASPDEVKAQTEFMKAYRVNDKVARRSALAILEGAKHDSSWKLIYNVAATDPEPEVRLAAFTVLAREPARDPSIAHLLAQLYSVIKDPDAEDKLHYAKAMATSEFKAELVYAVGSRLVAMRYPDVPRLIQTQGPGGSNDNRRQIENVEKMRKEYEELLAAFNEFAKSGITAPIKDTPGMIKRWLETNQSKLAIADKELADKYKKEDDEAAKAAKEAAAAAKATK